MLNQESRRRTQRENSEGGYRQMEDIAGDIVLFGLLALLVYLALAIAR